MVNGNDIVNYAKNFLGVPYVFGGTSPSGFDCSGFVQYVYKHFGINISRTTKTQINDGVEVGKNELQPGDLVFTNDSHVTLYIGNKQLIHAPQPGEKVKISNMWAFWRARRILSNCPPPPNNQSTPTNRTNHSNIGKFNYQTPTGLHQTGNTFTFAIGCSNLYIINKRDTGSKTTEVHRLTRASDYKNFDLHTGTGLHETGDNWEFLLGDYNHDGHLDLYCINKRDTGSKKTEVHILGGASCFKNFLLHTDTGLHETDDNWKFCLGYFNGDGNLDLFCIAKNCTGSKKTEVHILSGASNFHTFIMQTGTGLHETDGNWDFGVSDYCGQGKKDLYCIAKRNTGSKKTEVHVLSGSSNFQNFVLHTSTDLHETDDDYLFYPDGNNLYMIKRRGGSNTTEVHILNV